MESTRTNITRLKQYSDILHVDNFVDFLISANILDKTSYYNVWEKPKRNRLNEIYNRLLGKDKNLVGKALDYLNEQHPNIEEVIQEDIKFRKCLVRGGFPKLPVNHVKRIELATDVKNIVENLSWTKKLVIHGMVGNGKSCLVNEVLSDNNLCKHFDYQVFWVNLGKNQDLSEIMEPMQRLHCKVCHNLDNCHRSDDIQNLQDHLKSLFLEDRLYNALLVLDDVCSSEIVQLFDFGCKCIIISQYKNIIGREDADYIEVKNGFSRRETLELFEMAVDKTFDHEAAEEMYSISKGHPMLIALIGIYLRDNKDSIYSTKNSIWEYIKENFLMGHYSLNNFDEHSPIPSQIAKHCIDVLLSKNSLLKSRYEDLAVFPLDVNIPPEVLQLLWNTSLPDVINTMNKLAEKSLVVTFYHDDYEKFIYGVHDIYLNCLKDGMKSKVKLVHQRLIYAYDKLTGGNYARLPNDNYSLHFIAYHLYCSERWEKMKVFLNLKFIEAKVRVAGKEDLLRDMQKYEEYITMGDKIVEDNLNSCKDFVHKYGASLINFPKTDIVQYALQETKDTYVYHEALRLAKETFRLYFSFQRPTGDMGSLPTIHLKEEITYACFVDSPHHVLVANATGKIKLFFEFDDKEISTFEGHKSAIKCMKVSPDKTHFLSVGMDKLVYLWKFNNLNSNCPVSPKTTQKCWQDIFTLGGTSTKPRKKFCLEDTQDFLVSADFSSDFPTSHYIVTGSYDGDCMIWNSNTGKIFIKICKGGHDLSFVYMSTDILMFSSFDELVIYDGIRTNDAMLPNVMKNAERICCFFVTNEEVLIVGENTISVWRDSKRDYVFRAEEGLKNACAAITDNGLYLIVGTDRHTIYIWDVVKHKTVRVFESKGLVKSLDTYYDDNSDVHILLIGSDKKSLQQCYVQPYEIGSNVHSVVTFTPYWKKKQPLIPLVSLPENKVQVFQSYTLICEGSSETDKITCTCFTSCGNVVLYGLSSGEIRKFNIKTKEKERLKSVESRGAIKVIHSIENLDIITAVCSNGYISVYNKDDVSALKFFNPVVHFNSDLFLIIVDANCDIYKWYFATNKLVHLKLSLGSGNVTCSTFNQCENLMALCVKREKFNYLHIIDLKENENGFVKKTVKVEGYAKCSSFSQDGKLIALGMESGAINIWRTFGDFKLTVLELHKEPIEKLLFLRGEGIILISLSEEVAWWNLTALKSKSNFSRGGKPNSIDLSDNLEGLCINSWISRAVPKEPPYLLSCLKFPTKIKFISVSCNLTSFLFLDEMGKIYILEVLPALPELILI